MKTKVSVIIPTYNREQELLKAVDSVIQQTIQVDEILIINDGLLDEKIQTYLLSLDNNIQIHHNSQSLGGNFSRNRGARLSTGNILMFLDDDDTWNKDKVAKQLDIFANDSSIGLVYSNRNVVDAQGKVSRKIKSKSEGNLYPQIFYENLIGGTSSVAIRRETFFQAGAFDEKLPALQDYDLWIRICRISNIGLDKSCTVNYRVIGNFSGQITGSIEKKKVAVSHILIKYQQEISELGFIASRKVKSKLYLSLARSVRGKDYTLCCKYSFRSFLFYPSLRALFFMLPF